MGFSRQEYCSGLPFPLIGDFPDPGIEPRSSACGDPKMKEQVQPRRVLECRNRKTRHLSPFPSPCCNYSRISGPPEQYNLSPLLPYREKVFAFSSSTQYTCLIQSANDPQDPYPTPCTLAIKVDKGPLLNISSPLSWSTVLTASPTLINFILLSFCLMSGNSFPTHAWTMTLHCRQILYWLSHQERKINQVITK